VSESKPDHGADRGQLTYEDTVVAYYSRISLGREPRGSSSGLCHQRCRSTAKAHGNPMDDLVVEFDDVGTKRILGLQIKRSVTISGRGRRLQRPSSRRLPKRRP